MTPYFSPDIKSLREVSESERKAVLGLADELDATPAPDLMFVEQLLNMIHFARDVRATPASVAA